MNYGPRTLGSKDLTYNDYLKVNEMLSLQQPVSEPVHHDELLFIIIHQAYELWFKLILAELERAMDEMEKGEALRARHFTHRVVEIMRVLIQQIHVLETMDPVEFLHFRDRLNPASGFQSLQFREVEFVCGLKSEMYLKYFQSRPDQRAILEKRMHSRDLRETYMMCLKAHGFKIDPKWIKHFPYENESECRKFYEVLLPVYQNPNNHLPLYLLSESLVDLDQGLALWREHHVRVVERLIGFKRGTGGSSGVEYLKSTTAKKCFPLLWDIRTELKKA